ncbi:MAG: GGDEF domain-containing protein [Gorillibacterium sp.]|nr:GGDEF domain-containing protein [Gorillibacterium sp.]
MLRRYRGNYEHTSSWNRKICRSYWILGLLIFALVLITLPFMIKGDPDALHLFIRNQIIIQSSLILGLQILAEAVCRLHSKLQDYIILTIGSCFASIILASTSSAVHGVQIIMCLPILISIFYFNYWKVIFSCMITLIFYLLTMAALPAYRDNPDFFQKSIGFTLILFCTIASLGIVNRGLEMIKHEKEALLNEAKHRLQERIMNEASQKDALTGLNNHKAFQEKIRLMVHDPCKRSMYLAMIDIDDFKSVNDTFGHWVGDTVLNRIGTLLKNFSDQQTITSRYGGEEFAVIFAGIEKGNVLERLEKLRADVEQTEFSELNGRRITISVGCRQLVPDEDCDSLFKRADDALYLAKRGGKNRVV